MFSLPLQRGIKDFLGVFRVSPDKIDRLPRMALADLVLDEGVVTGSKTGLAG
jgi:hypothetical protein